MDKLEMWTVYERPRDYPDGYVARKWLVDRVATPTGEVRHGRTLDEVREQLPPGLYRLPRNPEDDPVVVETWI